MIVTLQTERVRTLDQVRAFVEGSEAVDFTGADRESVYEFVRRALVRLDYGRLGKSDKGLVRRYLAKVTGLSRAQLTRLIGQHRETGRIEDRRGGTPACPFERRYTRADIRQLAAVDAAMGQMSGPATRALMRRQYEVFGDERFERLAGLSNGHLYNLRRSVTYQRRRTVVAKTQATHNAIGQRRKHNQEPVHDHHDTRRSAWRPRRLDARHRLATGCGWARGRGWHVPRPGTTAEPSGVGHCWQRQQRRRRFMGCRT